MRHNRYPS